MPLFRRDAPSPAADSASSRPEPRRPPAARAAGERAASRAAEPPSVITRGAIVEGEITGSAELRIEGEVRGKVELQGRAVVGPSGVVRGELVARTVLVAGQVFGDVRGTEQVELADSGRLEGDIAAPRVAIAEGAFFKGRVEMTGQGAGRRPDERTPARPGEAPPRPNPSQQRTEPTPGGRPPSEAPE